MSDSTKTPFVDEFYLCSPTLKVFGKVAWTDEEGEEVFGRLEPILDGQLAKVKAIIEGQFPNVRVGYEID